MVDLNFSISTQDFEADADGSGLAGAAVEALRARGDTDRWQVATNGFWCSLTPSGQVQRSLHGVTAGLAGPRILSDRPCGILAFLLRLRHRSPRLWMVNPLLERSLS